MTIIFSNKEELIEFLEENEKSIGKLLWAVKEDGWADAQQKAYAAGGEPHKYHLFLQHLDTDTSVKTINDAKHVFLGGKRVGTVTTPNWRGVQIGVYASSYWDCDKAFTVVISTHGNAKISITV
jgi:hypothetical protein